LHRKSTDMRAALRYTTCWIIQRFQCTISNLFDDMQQNTVSLPRKKLKLLNHSFRDQLWWQKYFQGLLLNSMLYPIKIQLHYSSILYLKQFTSVYPTTILKHPNKMVQTVYSGAFGEASRFQICHWYTACTHTVIVQYHMNTKMYIILYTFYWTECIV